MTNYPLMVARDWEQQDLDLEQVKDSWVLNLLASLALVVVVGLGMMLLVEGIERQAQLDQSYAAGRRQGRLEMLHRVKQETEKEGRTWLAFYRAASQPELSGFDGLLIGNNDIACGNVK